MPHPSHVLLLHFPWLILVIFHTCTFSLNNFRNKIIRNHHIWNLLDARPLFPPCWTRFLLTLQQCVIWKETAFPIHCSVVCNLQFTLCSFFVIYWKHFLKVTNSFLILSPLDPFHIWLAPRRVGGQTILPDTLICRSKFDCYFFFLLCFLASCLQGFLFCFLFKYLSALISGYLLWSPSLEDLFLMLPLNQCLWLRLCLSGLPMSPEALNCVCGSLVKLYKIPKRWWWCL